MSEIKCLENYKQLREMISRGEKGSIEYFTDKVGIKPRTFRRLIKYLNSIDNIEVNYDKYAKMYYVD